jgi:hypothetical protein
MELLSELELESSSWNTHELDFRSVKEYSNLAPRQTWDLLTRRRYSWKLIALIATAPGIVYVSLPGTYLSYGA